MAVTYLKEDAGGRTATNSRGIRTYTRVFLFETDSQTDDAWEVGSHPDAPRIGQAFRDAWCISSTPACIEPWKGWSITAEYSSERELNEDPLLDAMQIRVYTEQFQKPAIFNADGSKIVNSAGDPYDPPPMMDDSRRVISLVRNVPTHPSWVLDYQDAVNSDSFFVKGVTYAVGVGKVQSVSISDGQKRNGIDFHTLEVLIHCQKNGWILKTLDAGFRELKSGSGSGSGAGGAELVNILNQGDGERVAAPVPLDGSGHALENPSPTNNVLRSDIVYDELPFSVLFA
jgi:hypothetical protein